MRFDLVIDAENKILGRIASLAAKELLNGKRVAIINAEKAVITGNPQTILKKYQTRRSIQSKINPRMSPIQPRTPDRIVWRTIRGMLPMKKTKGREALRRLRVFIGVPEELVDVEKDTLIRGDEREYVKYTVDSLKPKKRRGYVTVLWLSKQLGWRGAENVA
ncbi:MAG: 50S ribosomal protein L13 [Candidatus Korarchaeum sp.]|nr:50S ribosomal protein L13 [Candidatus Korarchaeum sp.]MDW8035182.1 50S ribosomal protein L13 [Candidatus Korarchaeum sp.]